jgi:hypothetical protein
MRNLNQRWLKCALFMAIAVTLPGGAPGHAAENGGTAAGPRPATAVPPSGPVGETPAATTAGPATIEDQLREQTLMLRQMQEMLVEQQAEIERLRSEVDAMRGGATAAGPALATGAGPTAEAARAAADRAPAPAPPPRQAGSAQGAGNAGDDLKKQVGELARRWGNLRLTGDLRLRSELFFNQGFDALNDVDPRYRLRLRARAQISGDLGKYFDWGLRLGSGSYTDPTSTNQTLTDVFGRKPFGIDRAFLHFNSRTEPATFEIWAGKFDPNWKRTSLTFDPDVQVEGLSESITADVGDDSPLRTLKLTAWQLPLRERSVGADAYIYGGQVLTDWKFGDHWGATVAGAFHDFEQIDIVAPVLGISNTQVGGGLELAPTNTIVVNPFTNLPEFRSNYRVVNALGEVTYDALGGSTRWPLMLRADWIRNTSAFNNQKDGGSLTAEVGRASEEGDWLFDYIFWKVEREAFPSFLMESDVAIQTNSLAHIVSGSYMLRRNVQLQTNYFLTRRLQTNSPENRWLNRFQFDVIYKF